MESGMELKLTPHRLHVENLLAEGKRVELSPQGYSMHPFLTPGRDRVVLEAADGSQFKKGDVVLYKRDNGLLVLHRICRIGTDGIYLVGDNQSVIEGPLGRDQIKGIVTEYLRRGRRRSVKYMPYRCISSLWLVCLPVRPLVFCLVKFRKKLLYKMGLIKKNQ